MKRIFISYRHTTPDKYLANQIFEALRQNYSVFIDETMLIGVRWAEEIETQLKQTDYLVVLLSESAVNSEMVVAEIETAHQLYKQFGRPQILPIRLAYEDPFAYPLSAYLNHINWASWKNDADTNALIEELMQAISGGSLSNSVVIKSPIMQDRAIPVPVASAQPITTEAPEGTITINSQFYIDRKSDIIAEEALKRAGVTVTIKGPRQMGKSSLLVRLVEQSRKQQHKVAFLDFQLFDRAAIADAKTFFYQFCTLLTDTLKLEDKLDQYWKSSLGNTQLCTRYIEYHVLQNLQQPVVLAMDEVEGIFDTPFRTDFFSMLRHWHNSRAISEQWRNLSLVLVTSTEPYQFTENLNQSPFNVGEVIELQDFSAEQTKDLNSRHQYPFNAQELDDLEALLNGHPYLTRKALYLIACNRLSTQELFTTATRENGPFGDHLRYHLFRLHGKDDLINGLLQVLRHQRCTDDKIFFRLHGAGLVRRSGHHDVVTRNKLYQQFFEEYLNV